MKQQLFAVFIFVVISSSHGIYFTGNNPKCNKCFELWQGWSDCNPVYRTGTEEGECGQGVRCRYRIPKDPQPAEYGCGSRKCQAKPTSDCEKCDLGVGVPLDCNTAVSCEFGEVSGATDASCKLTVDQSGTFYLNQEEPTSPGGTAALEEVEIPSTAYGVISLQEVSYVVHTEQFACGSLEASIIYASPEPICLNYEFSLASDVVFYIAIMDKEGPTGHKRETMRKLIADFQANGDGFLADDGRNTKLIAVHTAADTKGSRTFHLHFSSSVPVFAMVPTSGGLTEGSPSQITVFKTGCNTEEEEEEEEEEEK